MKTIKDIRAIRTIKFSCSSCHTHYRTLPKYVGLDKGDECPLCGCTSFNMTKGRPIGRKSFKWNYEKEMIDFLLNGKSGIPYPNQYFVYKTRNRRAK